MLQDLVSYAQALGQSLGGAIFLGAVSGGLLGALVALVAAIVSLRLWLVSARESIARHLLSEALRVQSMFEAWIVVGEGWKAYELDRNRPLQTTSWFADVGPPALFPVEIRAVLDRPIWNAPEDHFYTFIQGRRTWIVRAKLAAKASYGKISPEVSERPAILSSRALEELCGWIEEVASAGSSFERLLSADARGMILPVLAAVAGQDRIGVLKTRLTDKAQCFLKRYRREHSELSILDE